MNELKRWLGILWMILGPLIFFLLIKSAVENIGPGAKGDINRPLPWVIVISVFTPIAMGFVLFGWYAWKGEYNADLKNDDRKG